MKRNRTETKWFLAMVIFLIVYSVFLFVFRYVLAGIDEKYLVSVIKPEPVQVWVTDLLVLLYYFGFAGLYYFSRAGNWQKIAAALVGLVITVSLLYGFYKWYHAIDNPFFQSRGIEKFPWYADEEVKFLLVNMPIVLYLLIVFILRVFMMFDDKGSSLH